MKKGIIFILIATFSFAWMNIIAKQLSDFHPLQVVFFRAFGNFAFIFPFMVYKGISIKGKNPKLLLLRGIVGLVSLALFFTAIQNVPVASAVSIRYTAPIFGAVMAYYFLKEKINTFQWIGFLIACIGVILLKGFDVRIDFINFILLLLSAILVGAVFVLVRYLATREHYLTIINYFMIISILSSLFFISHWRMPLPYEWKYVISIGLFGLIGQVFMTRAFREAETSIIAPFKYAEVVYAMILGLIFFNESYTEFALLGIGLIVGGMIMNVFFKKA